MTLTQIADFVCKKVNQQETEDKAIAKDFIRRRLEMIWNDQLWKDSIVEYSTTIDPATAYSVTANYLPTKGVLILPPEIGRVLAVRTGERALDVVRHELHYRQDLDAFNQTGTPWQFVLLPPVVWELDERLPLYLTRSDAGDVGPVSIDTLDSNGVDVTRADVTLTATDTAAATSDRVDELSKGTSVGTITLKAGFGVRITNNNTNSLNITPAGSSTTTVIPFGQSADFDSAASFAWMVNIGVDITGTYTPTGGADFIGTLTFNGLLQFAESAAYALYSITSLSASDTTAKLRQRVRFLAIPDSEATVRVLGKAKAPALLSDNDQLKIQGIENAIIAFVQGDMLERERQYGKANLKFQEGTALLDQLKAVETVQQAHNQRIIPDSGYGDPNDLYSHPPLTY